MIQTREKWNSLVFGRADFWMVWRHYGIPYIRFIFCLEPTVKKKQFDGNDFLHGYGIFRKCYPESFLISA